MASQAPTPEQILFLVQDIIRTAPMFHYDAPMSEDDRRWLGRADALLDAAGDRYGRITFKTQRDSLFSVLHDRNKLLMPLYDLLARSELMVPAGMQGAFIPPGDTWNGYAAIVGLIQKPCADLLVVDPYLTADLYLHFAPHSVASNGIRCLTAQQTRTEPGLIAAATKWASDGLSASHPVSVRYAPSGSLHDRLIIIDGKEVWLVSQSFKDIAKRSPASVTRIEAELGAMKSQHYEALWNSGTPIA